MSALNAKPLRSKIGRVPLAALLVGAAGVVLGISWLNHTVHSQPTPIATKQLLITQSISPALTPPVSEGFVLRIEKMGVTAPIILDVPGTNEQAYLKAIEGGVAQYAGTAHPGQIGNMFIFGHSSYYKNKPGQYKEVFKQLDQLQSGDKIVIENNGAVAFTYIVTGSKIVSDSDTSILKDSSNKMLTLMTCWPPGTTKKRYVVTAELLAS